MEKAEESVKAMITEEQLKKVTDQQNKLSEALKHIGILEVQKTNLVKDVLKISKEVDETKKELEDEYGQVNIDLSDGSYTDVEKEDEE
jgi:hypothetical protein